MTTTASDPYTLRSFALGAHFEREAEKAEKARRLLDAQRETAAGALRNLLPDEALGACTGDVDEDGAVPPPNPEHNGDTCPVHELAALLDGPRTMYDEDGLP